MPRLCSGLRTSAVGRKNFTTKSILHKQDDDGPVISMIKNCCSKKKIADETLISTTTPNCSTTQKAAYYSVAAANNNLEMSPKRALRAAMLKQRFADTIFKATHHHQIQGSCNNNTKQLERSELGKEKMKAKRRIEAEFKAAKKAAIACGQLDDHSKRRLVLSNQRAAARMALEKMEKSVYVGDDNASLLKGLEMICGDSVAYELFYGKGCVGVDDNQDVNPLEKLGLYLKEDYNCDYQQDDDEAVLMDLEEGEILF